MKKFDIFIITSLNSGNNNESLKFEFSLKVLAINDIPCKKFLGSEFEEENNSDISCSLSFIPNIVSNSSMSISLFSSIVSDSIFLYEINK